MKDQHPGIGLRRGSVRVVPADLAWPDVFRGEATRLHARLELANLPPLLFEHIGSIAVPGLAAKPIIDFMGGYAAAADLQVYMRLLVDAGYEHRGPQGVPERELFVLGPEDRRTHHLNLVLANGHVWHEHVSFRDRLRNEPELAAAYAELKYQLAVQHVTDRGAYTAAKSKFIRQVIDGSHHRPAS